MILYKWANHSKSSQIWKRDCIFLFPWPVAKPWPARHWTLVYIIYIHIYIYTYIYAYIYVYTYIHTHVYIYIYMCCVCVVCVVCVCMFSCIYNYMYMCVLCIYIYIIDTYSFTYFLRILHQLFRGLLFKLYHPPTRARGVAQPSFDVLHFGAQEIGPWKGWIPPELVGGWATPLRK